jgi:hypothetical protein
VVDDGRQPVAIDDHAATGGQRGADLEGRGRDGGAVEEHAGEDGAGAVGLHGSARLGVEVLRGPQENSTDGVGERAGEGGFSAAVEALDGD